MNLGFILTISLRCFASTKQGQIIEEVGSTQIELFAKPTRFHVMGSKNKHQQIRRRRYETNEL